MIDTLARAGRPTRLGSKERSNTILQVAGALFRERGFAGTSIEQIAATARVGKHTVYRRFASKEILFVAVIRDEFEQITKVLEIEDFFDHLDLLDQLRVSFRARLRASLNPWVVAFYRIGISEVVRFPNLGEMLRDGVMNDTIAMLLKPIEAAQAQNLIMQGDPAFICRYLAMAINGEPFTRALLGADDYPDAASLDAYFDKAWNAAMRGIMVKG